MTTVAQGIVQKIGEGVAEALRTNWLFLGVEEEAFKNPDIHPEYVTTVEVAKKLTGWDRIVSLETHMKELRRHAHMLARVRNGMKTETLPKINATLARYRFGKKDSQRVDILVRPSDDLSPPLLIAEAKLGVKNLPGILKDIDRITKLLTMYRDLDLLCTHHIFGAVLFHHMEEGSDGSETSQRVQDLLVGIDAYLKTLRLKQSWIRARSGLLTHGAKTQPVTGYKEIHHDGTEESVFGKDCFTFAPGLILLGNSEDVDRVTF